MFDSRLQQARFGAELVLGSLSTGNKKGYRPPARPCGIPDCKRPAHGRKYCLRHYKRWYKYGDPLAGSTEWGAAQALLDVLTAMPPTVECVQWPYTRTKNGSAQVRIKGRPCLVTRVLCDRVHGPAPTPKHQAAHSCGKGHEGCVNPHHLSWKTQKENEQDKHLHGTSWATKAEPHPLAKLTADDVRQIRALRAGGASRTAIAKLYGVSASNISRVCSRNSWKHI